MPRACWLLRHQRPAVRIVLPAGLSGPPAVRFVLADTGAGSATGGFEVLLDEQNLLLYGGRFSGHVNLRGAYWSVPIKPFP